MSLAEKDAAFATGEMHGVSNGMDLQGPEISSNELLTKIFDDPATSETERAQLLFSDSYWEIVAAADRLKYRTTNSVSDEALALHGIWKQKRHSHLPGLFSS